MVDVDPEVVVVPIHRHTSLLPTRAHFPNHVLQEVELPLFANRGLMARCKRVASFPQLWSNRFVVGSASTASLICFIHQVADFRLRVFDRHPFATF